MRRAVLIVAAVIAVLAAVVVTGVTDAFGTGAQLRTNLGGSVPDGATSDTFWDSSVIDLPGFAITGVHCHGRVQYEVQAGATGPIDDNACYAAMGMYDAAGSQQWGVYEMLPGNRAVYRTSDNSGPWRYCIGELATGPLSGPGLVIDPCL